MVDRGILDKKATTALFVDARIRAQVAEGGPTKLLSQQFHPGNWDVVCHTGKDVHEHSQSKSNVVIMSYYSFLLT